MGEIPGQNPDAFVGNRKQRRRAFKSDPLSRSVAELNMASTRYIEIQNKWSALSQAQAFWPTLAFNEHHAMIPDTINAARVFSQTFQKVQNESLKEIRTVRGLQETEKRNIYDHPTKGLSLRDIERMEAPLSSDEFDAITDMMKHGRFFGKGNALSNDVKILLCQFAIEGLIDSERRDKLPEPLQALHTNMVSYFDEYTRLYYDSNLSISDTIGRTKNTTPHTFEAVLPFLAARYNLVPSSVPSIINPYIWWSFLSTDVVKRFRSEVPSQVGILNHSVPFNTLLPQDIQPLTLYDGERTKAVDKMLVPYLGQKYHETTAQIQAHEQRNDVVHSLAQIQDKIHYTIQHAQDRRIAMALPDHPEVTTITVSHQNRENLVYIATLKSGASFVFETDRYGKIYGITHKMQLSLSHAEDFLADDLLKPFVEEMKKRFSPQPEKQMTPLQPIVSTDSSRPVSKRDSYQPQSKKEKTEKQAHEIMTPIKATLREAPLISQEQQKVRFVAWDPEDVASELGKAATEGNMKRIRETIQRFELGGGRVGALTDADELTLKLRTGNFRLALRHEGEQNYSLVLTGARKDVWRGVIRRLR